LSASSPEPYFKKEEGEEMTVEIEFIVSCVRACCPSIHPQANYTGSGKEQISPFPQA